MLVITRKKDESILIGDDIEIKIIKIDDRSVKLAIDAPRDKVILRKEIYENVKDENSKAIANIDDIFKLFKEVRRNLCIRQIHTIHINKIL